MKTSSKKDRDYIETKDQILLSQKRCEELWDKKIINTFEVGTWKGLKQIHQYIFQDVFDFAGKMRHVNISKDGFSFAPFMFLEKSLEDIDKMPHKTFDEIIQKYSEMNVAHPFREGNGRATRIWLDNILKHNLNHVINWSQVDKYLYFSAMVRSPVNTAEINVLLRKNLTDKINDRETFMKGIIKSYEYEGYKIETKAKKDFIKENNYRKKDKGLEQ